MVSSDYWDAETARGYDSSSAAMFAPEVVEPTGSPVTERHGDWKHTPFTSDSTGHVSVWRKPP